MACWETKDEMSGQQNWSMVRPVWHLPQAKGLMWSKNKL